MNQKIRLTPGVTTNWGMTVGGGSEVVEGFNHNLRDLGVRDCGGPVSIRRELDYHQFGHNTTHGVDAYLYWLGSDPVNDWPTSQLSTDEIKALGTTAISNTTPNSPAFDFSVAAGELLSEGLPSAFGFDTWRTRAINARGAGKEYLNAEFGWLPLVSDIRNFSRVVVNHSKIMSSYFEGSGKDTRVSFDFPSSLDVTYPDTSSMGLRWYDYIFFNGDKSCQVVKESRQWFKGCFTYYATPRYGSNSLADKAFRYGQMANHLLGIRLTPETLWNLTPWSWATDWFTNAGDIIHNVTAFQHDSLVLKYGYIMSHESIKTYASSSGGSDFGGSYTGGSRTSIRERKTRFGANPYFGFGATSDLSDSQKVILLALGLSKA